MKKSCLLLVFVFVTLLCGKSFAFYDFGIGGFYYKIISGNKVMVTYPSNNSFEPYSGYSKPTGNRIIPSNVTWGTTTYVVTSIDQWTFSGCTGLTSITIPSSVTSIGYYAFKDCSGLNSITVDGGNTTFDSRNNCNAIIHTATNKLIVGCKTTVIPNTVTAIGDCAFLGCSGLTSIIIPNSVTTICECVFQNCSGLTSVSIGSSVTSIGHGAFANCGNLTSVTIPNLVTTIGNHAFQNCSSLTSVIIPNLVASIGLCTFYGCNSLTSVTIPNSVISIDSAAFQNCSSLTSITIPNSVTTIGGAAFRGCSSLTSVTIPNSVTTIGNRTFQNCGGLTTVIIPNSVTSIGDYAFYYCIGLTEINSHPVEAPTLGNNTFYQVSNTLPVIIPCGSTTSYQLNWGDYFSNFIEPIIPSINVSTMDVTMGNADIFSNPCDSAALIEAVANYGYHFTAWNDGDTNNPRIITLTQDTLFTAFFSKNLYNINGISSNIERGSVEGSSTAYYLDTIILTATANYGYHFSKWNDNNTDNPRQIVVTDNISKTAIFDPNIYSISVLTDTSIHGNCTGSGNFGYMSQRTIMATANYGYHFIMWNDGNTTNPRTITLTQDTVFTAYFAKNQYTVTGVANDNVRGVVLGGETTFYLDTITLTSIANYGYHFSMWDDNNTDNPRQIVVTGNISRTAVFDFNQYSITALADSSIHGHCIGAGAYNYLSQNAISAIANHGYHFTQWNDSDTNNPRTITLTQDTSFIAMFAKNYYNIVVLSVDSTQGVVMGSTTKQYLDTVNIAATANYGYQFSHWSDGSTTNPRIITLTQDSIITAYFAKNQYTLTVISADESMGTVSGGGTYDYGDTIIATATPVCHYHFLHWDDGNTENPRNIQIQGDYTITAFFAIDTHTVIVVVNDIEGGVVEVTGTEFVYGTPCTVTAIANSGYEFVQWNNGVTCNPYTFVVQEDMELTAFFLLEDSVGIGEVGNLIAKVYSNNGLIVVEGAERNDVTLYDQIGRRIAIRRSEFQPLHFTVPTSGIYIIKIGNYPARKVVVIR